MNYFFRWKPEEFKRLKWYAFRIRFELTFLFPLLFFQSQIRFARHFAFFSILFYLILLIAVRKMTRKNAVRAGYLGVLAAFLFACLSYHFIPFVFDPFMQRFFDVYDPDPYYIQGRVVSFLTGIRPFFAFPAPDVILH